MNRLKAFIAHKFSGKRGIPYYVVGLIVLLMLCLLAVPTVKNTISLIDSIFNSKYEMDYMVAAGIVVSALLCMAFENVFTIPVVKEDVKFRRGWARARHIVSLVLVTVGIRVLYALTINPSTALNGGELSKWTFSTLGLHSPWILTIFNIAFYTISVLCIYFISYILCKRWNAAFAAAVAVAFWPNSLFATTVAGTQSHVVICLTLMTLLMGMVAIFSKERPKVWVSIVAMVAMGFISGALTVISFVGMVVPFAMILAALVKRSQDKFGNRVRLVYAVGGLLCAAGFAIGLGYLAYRVTGDKEIFSSIFTAGAELPNGLLAKFSTVWGGDYSMVDSMMSNSIKPSIKSFASVYDSLYGSPLIIKAICQLYYTGMLYITGRGIFISFRNGDFDSRPAIGLMVAVILSVGLTVVSPSTQIYHMPAIALVMCLSSLGFEAVEPDYEGL